MTGSCVLKILYVGPDPTREPVVPDYEPNPARVIELTKERPAAFNALLRQHFPTVKVVTSETYDASMSDDYEVTIFDALPRAARDALGRDLRLPEDFDKPAVTLGEVGPMMLGRWGLGLKLDHL